MPKLNRWAREPLVHFLVAGAMLFVFFAWKGQPVDPASRTIEITQEDRARLALQWEATMQRPPTDAELDSLTSTWLREEILYREAIRLGLDRDDAIVRKRLANKMDFLASSEAETEQPSDTVLQKWLDDNPQKFADETTYSFDQIYFTEQSAAKAALPLARKPGDWQKLGEQITLPQEVKDLSVNQVQARFGMSFVEKLQAVEETGTWTGPIPSGFGWHLVRLQQREIGTVPPLAEIRERVENDWRSQTLEKRRNDAYQMLLESYRVTTE